MNANYPPPVPTPVVRVQRLDERVVNRIAAGEIIHRPANALKELLENAFDSGATTIQIAVKDGGLKLLQIQDNGSGIAREDLGIVCERFTTSKLRAFDDLSTIATFGFRGEALASISHVAHLTITTKTKDSNCAYRKKKFFLFDNGRKSAIYVDGQLAPAKPGASVTPRPCAGNTGTQITVEDLFYNVPTRKKAFKSVSEEYNRILDLVGRYAVHNAGVALTCRKQASPSPEIHTTTSASTIDNIRHVYGAAVASELLNVNAQDEVLQFQLTGWISNANYSVKRTNFLLFINHRLVESVPLRKAIESIYTTYLSKGAHPFVYLSLILRPETLDVNVHPTKKSVVFLYEEELTQKVGKILEQTLMRANSSRNFLVQTVLPHASGGVQHVRAQPQQKTKLPADGEDDESVSDGVTLPAQMTNKGDVLIQPSKSASSQKPYENRLVRTDSRVQTLEKFFEPMASSSQVSSEANKSISQDEVFDSQMDQSLDSRSCAQPSTVKPRPLLFAPKKGKRRRRGIPVELTSMHTLRKELQTQSHKALITLFADHSFVGTVNERLALVQHGTKIYLVNYERLSEEYFYNVAVCDFANYSKIAFDPPLSIRDLLLVALEMERSECDGLQSNDTISEQIVELLESKKDMLLEYYRIQITGDGQLVSLPILLEDSKLNLDKIPLFLLRLGSEVNWATEIDCFRDVCRELAILHTMEPPRVIAERSEWSSARGDTVNISKNVGVMSPNSNARKEDDTLITPSLPTDTEVRNQAETLEAINLTLEGNDVPCERLELQRRQYLWTVEHCLFPAVKLSAKAALASLSLSSSSTSTSLKVGDQQAMEDHGTVAPFFAHRLMLEEGCVLQIADLPDLYRIFERC